MKAKIKKAIEEYQCPGCVTGCDVSCFENYHSGVGCGKHHAAMILPGVGKIFLGIPKGFCRLGEYTKLKPHIYTVLDDHGKYDMWNIPTWKHKNEAGHTLVRGLMPRRNEPFLHIYLEDCLDKIDCLEISKEDIDGMD